MSRYERQKVVVSSLSDGDVFELPRRPGTICRVTFHKLKEDEDGQQIGIIGYDIVEGPLHMPVLYMPADYPITLLLPTTTYVKLTGKDWIESLTEHHGVSE